MSARERLAVRLPNWVGDVCMALPALAALAESADCVFFARRWAAELLAGMPWSVEVAPPGVRATARALRASGASRTVLLTNSFSSALAARLGGAPGIGFAAHWRRCLLGATVPRAQEAHEAAAFWAVARAALGTAGAALPTAPPLPRAIAPLESHRAQARAALARAGVAGAYGVICPLAQGAAHGRSKVWPSFPLLCRGLIDLGATLVACPGPGEEAACAAASPGAHQLAGLGLGAYAAVLAGARGAIANDSGPMHLAAAVGVPVVGIFGVSDPLRTAPRSERARVVGSGHGWPTLQAVVAAWTDAVGA
jgi:heptosyltransferase-2